MSSNQSGGEPKSRLEADKELPAWLELVRKQVDSLKFGTVQITVHDSHVTQVERLEKVRLDRPK
ncbi:MAG TPA: YezD family protein [Verrucomicrobiae bacterium]|jgi:hypothetical protein|nr:YezD family protein [Verrucomicrobiae bacterium]